ncbi:MAG: translation initiation factor IF-2 [Clostridia bacterium]|nr:translation initiation factor IF-2 [Clostridia bacterium]
MAARYEDIENIGKLISDGKVADFSKKVGAAEKKVAEILKKLSDLEKEKQAKKLEEERLAAEKIAAEEAAKRAAEQAAKAAEEAAAQTKEIEKPAQPAVKAESHTAANTAPKENKTFVNHDTRPQKPAPRNPQFNNRFNGGNSAPSRSPQATRFTAPAASAPAAQPAKNKNFGPDKKKQSFDRTYVEKDRRTMSKRALVKQQGASIDDFDENKSGYRKLRLKKDKKQQSAQTIKIERAVVTTNDIPLKSLSEKLGISAVEITKRLFKEGVMKTVNESIDYDTAALVAAGLGIELEYKPEKTAEEVLFEKQADTVEEIESLVPRAPVVTVMGHVDHGKTSLLDYIRKTNAAAGEAGGITQHIGAYTVTVNGKGITFIDTPGHEAFTAMRARGAQVTDIVILVVAADDGIMPQTIEAINHAKAANVSIIVAVNKIDKAGANIDKVKQDLTGYGLVPEEWGGDTLICPISCKTGEGIDSLLESLLLIAEMKELLANPAREARGVIIEARLDKGKGPVATVLVQNGTLHTGDNLISGTVTGRVRAMIDDNGKTVKEAGPSMAVNVLGLEEVPNSGDSIFAVSQALMKQVMDERKRKESDAMVKAASKISLDEVFGKIAEGNMKTLNLIIKGDVQGSVEAVKQSVSKLSNEEVQVKVIHSGAGAVTETDVMLADSSNAIILGFNVRPDTKAKALAERSKVDVRSYRIIYDLLDDIEAALKGMLSPKYHEVYLGKCEVRQTFKITGVGNIAGCYVLEGKIVRGGKLRIYREDVLVVEGNVQQLKRFKDDVKEVAFGFECGCAIEGFNDIKVGDIIECYLIEQVSVS